MARVYVSGIGTVDSDGHYLAADGVWRGTNTLAANQIADIGAAFQASGLAFTGPGGQVYKAPKPPGILDSLPPDILGIPTPYAIGGAVLAVFLLGHKKL